MVVSERHIYGQKGESGEIYNIGSNEDITIGDLAKKVIEITGSKSVVKFSLPLITLGWAIALFHNLLYYKILPHSSSPCQQGVSCTSVHLEWLGFITIPLLSLVAFSLLGALMMATYKELKNEK